MGIFVQKSDNLVKLLEGMSLLDVRDQERIIKAVDTLDHVDKKVKKDLFSDCPDWKLETHMVYSTKETQNEY
jgi:hypothetical protein